MRSVFESNFPGISKAERKTQVFDIMSTFLKTKDIKNVRFGLRESVRAKMNHGFVIIGELARRKREGVKSSLDARSILNSRSAKNHQIISKQKMGNRRTGSRKLDALEVVEHFFSGQQSGKNFNIKNIEEGRHGVTLSDSSRRLDVTKGRAIDEKR